MATAWGGFSRPLLGLRKALVPTRVSPSVLFLLLSIVVYLLDNNSRASFSRTQRPEIPPVIIVKCLNCGAFQFQIEHYVSKQYLKDDLALQRTHVDIELVLFCSCVVAPRNQNRKELFCDHRLVDRNQSLRPGFNGRKMIRIKAKYYQKGAENPMDSGYTKYYPFKSFEELNKLPVP